MIKIKFSSILILLMLSVLQLNAQTVKINEVPQTIDEFVELRNKIATSPEGGATIFLLALKLYSENPNLGKQCLVAAADHGNLRKGEVYKGYELMKWDMGLIKMQIIDKNRKLPNSYIKGSSPENFYEVKLPYVYKFTSNSGSGDPETGMYKIFVKCYGADSLRPITLKKNNRGIWKASTWSSLLTGVKKSPFDDDI